jgi:short-subunit dehydrogenase
MKIALVTGASSGIGADAARHLALRDDRVILVARGRAPLEQVASRIEDTTPAEALVMLQAPCLAAFNVTHAFMSGMLARRSGTVIHVNSPAAIFPWPSSVGYAAARWAMRGLHESLCQDLADTGVQSCHVVFGRVDSPYFDHNPGVAERLPRIANTVRTLSTDECGRAIARLAENPKREMLYPFMLRFYGWSYHVLPALVLWLLRTTGAKRR